MRVIKENNDIIESSPNGDIKKEIAQKKFSEFMKQLKEKRKSDKKIFKDILVSIDNLTYYKERERDSEYV